MSPEPVDVRGIVEEAIGLIRPMAAARRITIARPDEGDGTFVLADRQRRKQVLRTLLSNAVKYNRDGGSVKVHARPGIDGRVRISVSDTGPGLDGEQMRRLFTPFDRLGAEMGTQEGTGLGLTLSKRLVEAMEGLLLLDSVVGVGTTFHVDLWQAPSPAELARGGGEQALPASDPGTTGRVLYIEDNLVNVRLVEHILRRRNGVDLLVAMQGSLGLALAREHHPDAIFLDLHLPDMEGSAVLERLKLDPLTQGIPVVILSADATAGSIQRVIRAGALEHMTQPSDMGRFLGLGGDLLGRARAGESPSPREG